MFLHYKAIKYANISTKIFSRVTVKVSTIKPSKICDFFLKKIHVLKIGEKKK